MSSKWKILVLSAALSALCGCSPKTPLDGGTNTGAVMVVSSSGTLGGTPSPAKTLTNEEKVSLLRTEAKNRDLLWKIFCVPKDDGSVFYYQAVAWQRGTTLYGHGGLYYEDGVRDWWAVGFADDSKTPSDSAFSLFQKIQGSPNMKVDPRPLPIEHKGGCDYQTVLDSEHPKAKPCRTNEDHGKGEK